MKQYRNKRLLALVGLTAMFLWNGCTGGGNELSDGNYPDDDRVRVSAVLNRLVSKAGSTAAYTGTDLGLFVDYGSGNAYTRNNVRWVNNGSNTWEQASGSESMYWKDAYTGCFVFAYAPYSASGVTMGEGKAAINFSVQTDQRAGTGSSDLVTYAAENFIPSINLDVSSRSIPVVFRHALSEVRVKLNFTGEFTTTPTSVSATLYGVQTTVQCISSPSGNTITCSGERQEVQMQAVGTTEFAAIIPPQGVVSGSPFVQLDVDGRTFTYFLPSANQTFTSGTTNTFTLRVGKEGVTMENITVGAWDDNQGTGGYDLGSGTPVVPVLFADTNLVAALQTLGVPVSLNKQIVADKATLTALAGITMLDISGRNIIDLGCVEFLTNLTELNCSNNLLSKIDTRGLPKLTSLNCSGNPLVSITLGNSQLVSLDVSNNALLQSVNIASSKLTTLNVSGCMGLNNLSCSNSQLTSLDVSSLINLQGLSCSNSKLTALDLSQNTKLNSLYCSRNQMSLLDVSMLPSLTTCRVEGQTTDGITLRNITVTVSFAQQARNLITLDDSVTISVK